MRKSRFKDQSIDLLGAPFVRSETTFHETSLTAKERVAAFLRGEMMRGTLPPGEPIIETRWAKRLTVSQTTVREALNLLAWQGFVQRGVNRPTCVTKLTVDDILSIHQMRATLESLAARLAAQKKPDVLDLELVIADMRAAMECKDPTALNERDVKFHILFCQKSGNRYLVDFVRQLLVPYFGFGLILSHMPAIQNHRLPEHEEMIDAIRTGDPDLAEQRVYHIIKGFGQTVFDLLRSLTP